MVQVHVISMSGTDLFSGDLPTGKQSLRRVAVAAAMAMRVDAVDLVHGGTKLHLESEVNASTEGPNDRHRSLSLAVTQDGDTMVNPAAFCALPGKAVFFQDGDSIAAVATGEIKRVVLISGVPKVDVAKYDRLLSVMSKVTQKHGDCHVFMPMDDTSGLTYGIILCIYEKARAAAVAISRIDSLQLDRSHKLKAEIFRPGLIDQDELREAVMSHQEMDMAAAESKTKPAVEIHGITVRDFIAAGFDFVQLRGVGFEARELRDARGSLNARQLKELDWREAGQPAFTCKELRDIGFDSKEVRGSGFNGRELLEAGFNYNDLRHADFRSNHLVAAGITARQMRDASLDAANLREFGFNVMELVEAGFNYDELVHGGFESEQVRIFFNMAQAGFFTYDELTHTANQSVTGPSTSTAESPRQAGRHGLGYKKRRQLRRNQARRQKKSTSKSTSGHSSYVEPSEASDFVVGW